MTFKLNHKLFATFILLQFFACNSLQNENVTLPDTILSEEKFTKILVDFALAESTSNINIKNISVTKMDSTYAFNPLEENKVSKAQYDSTVSFYSKHPVLYKKIYENVLTILSEMQIKKDSLKVSDSKK